MDIGRDIGHRIRDVSDAAENRLTGFRQRVALARQLESAGTAPAQPGADMVLEAFERHAEGRLLLASTLCGPADATRQDDLVKGAQQVPVEVAGEVPAGWRPGR